MFSRPAISVLFVCTANICRSPMAHALMRHVCRYRSLDKLVRVDSAGTHVALKGQRADPRALSVLRGSGIDIGRMRARPIASRDFERFDYIFAMDEQNIESLNSLNEQTGSATVELVMRFSRHHEEREVPDPYFGNDAGFEKVFTMLSDAVEGIVDDLLVDRLSSTQPLPVANP